MTATGEKSVLRVGVLIVDLPKPAADSLRFLVTHTNQLQRSFEFEVWETPKTDPLVYALRQTQPIAYCEEFIETIRGFASRQRVRIEDRQARFKLAGAAPEHYVIVSLASLSNHFYSSGGRGTTLLTLGSWERWMAPPSLVEFAHTLILRMAAGMALPANVRIRHLATRGCLFDFNEYLDTLRLKVLNSLICSECDGALHAIGRDAMADDLRLVMDKKWLGKADDPLSPAGISRKLGYDLYLSKGASPTFLEGAVTQLRASWLGELLKVAGVVLAAAFVLILGLKD